MTINVDTSAINVLSLCSGGGGLELGIELALPGSRVVCWCEWEAYAAAVLAKRMQDEALAPAPVWSDLRTFDGRPWRGVVDLLTAGFPCQPWSVAGKQAGADDPRHLWPHVLRVLVETDAPFGFFENVPGLVHNGGLAGIESDLGSAGYGLVPCPWSSAIVGNSHRRERLFIFAYKRGVDDAVQSQCGQRLHRRYMPGQADIPGGASEAVAHSPFGGLGIGGEPSRRDGQPDRGDWAVERAASGRRAAGQVQRGSTSHEGGATGRIKRLASAGGVVGDTKGAEPDGLRIGTREELASVGVTGGNDMADAIGQPSGEGDGRPEGREGEVAATVGEHDGDGLPLFAPGPGDLARWRKLLARHPEAEPAIRRDAPGMARRMERLRMLGNGVDPLAAATAFLHCFAAVYGVTK